MLNLSPRIVIFFILVTLIISTPLFRSGFYTSHDGPGHLERLVDFSQAIIDLQIPVRISQKTEFGIGYPFFFFNYPAPYFLAAVIHFLGFSFIDSWKVLMFLATFISGLGMYLYLRLRFTNLGSILGSLCYMFAPYHLLNLYVRGAFPELFSLSLIPWLFFAIDRTNKSFLFLAVIFAIFVPSHNITVAIFTPVIIFYVFLLYFENKDQKIIKNSLQGFLLGLSISAFYWIPDFYYQHLTNIRSLANTYNQNFEQLSKLIYSVWGFGGSNVGLERGEMAPQIGPLYLVLVMFSLYQLYRSNQNKKYLLFYLIFFLISVLFIIDSTGSTISKIVPQVQILQYPWRFLGIATFCIACITPFTIDKTYRPLRLIVFILLSLVIIYGARNQIRINEYFNVNLEKSVFGQGTPAQEHMPFWHKGRYLTEKEWNGTVIGEGESTRIIWNSNYHQFVVRAEKDSFFIDNTVYFPGWNMMVDGKEVEILFKDTKSLGRLMVEVPLGSHTVTSKFSDPPIAKL